MGTIEERTAIIGPRMVYAVITLFFAVRERVENMVSFDKELFAKDLPRIIRRSYPLG